MEDVDKLAYSLYVKKHHLDDKFDNPISRDVFMTGYGHHSWYFQTFRKEAVLIIRRYKINNIKNKLNVHRT